MTPLRSCCREPWWLSGGLLPGETVVCLCPPLSREMGDCLRQHLDAALEGGTAGRRGEEEEEKEERSWGMAVAARAAPSTMLFKVSQEASAALSRFALNLSH